MPVLFIGRDLDLARINVPVGSRSARIAGTPEPLDGLSARQPVRLAPTGTNLQYALPSPIVKVCAAYYQVEENDKNTNQDHNDGIQKTFNRKPKSRHEMSCFDGVSCGARLNLLGIYQS